MYSVHDCYSTGKMGGTGRERRGGGLEGEGGRGEGVEGWGARGLWEGKGGKELGGGRRGRV